MSILKFSEIVISHSMLNPSFGLDSLEERLAL